jgi:hypothetical protein
MRHIKFAKIIIVLFLPAIIWGCGKKAAPANEDRVLARINNYELTIADFKEAVVPAMMRRYASDSPLKDKEQILESLIATQVLLQEAQKLGLDKEKAFMKEIEGYWEQALLKSLVNRRLDELASKISVSDQEIANEYNRIVSEEGIANIEPLERLKGRIREYLLRAKKQAILEKWSADLKKKASIKIDKGLLKEIDLK